MKNRYIVHSDWSGYVVKYGDKIVKYFTTTSALRDARAYAQAMNAQQDRRSA